MATDTGLWVKEVLASVGILLVFVAAGKLLIFLLDRVVRKLTQKTETVLDDLILAAVEKPAFYLIVVWGAYISLDRLHVVLKQGVFDIADKIAFILVVALLVKMAYDVINAMLDWYGMLSEQRGRAEIARTILPLVKKVVKVFVILSGLILVLDHFEYSISSLVAALGVSSLAIGLAAKETLSNMISGFIIAADRPFRIGDRIETDGKVGEVVEIGLRSTRVRTLDNNIVIMPNTKLVDNAVVNYSFPHDTQTHIVKVGVEYGTDVEKVRRVMTEAASEVPEILGDPGPAAFFVEHGDSALVFQMFYHVSDFRQKWAAMDKVNGAVNRRFNEEGIRFAYPTRTLYVQDMERTT